VASFLEDDIVSITCSMISAARDIPGTSHGVLKMIFKDFLGRNSHRGGWPIGGVALTS
jgi:hypothetical protein